MADAVVYKYLPNIELQCHEIGRIDEVGICDTRRMSNENNYFPYIICLDWS